MFSSTAKRNCWTGFPPKPLLNFLVFFRLPNQLIFNSTVNLFPVGQLVDWSDQSVDQISSSIWPVGDHELLKDLITGWSPGLVLNQSINQVSINLLFKSFSFAALPTPTTPTVRDYQKLCPALTESPRWPFDNINRSLSLFQQICSLRKGKWWDSIAIRLLNQLKISFFIQLKFNLLIGNPQRWPCGALFCRLLVETRNSSTTEWYTCLNNQKMTLLFLLLICVDQQWWIAD